MLQRFLLLLLLLCGVASAQTTTPTADSLVISQRNPANNGVIVYYVVPDGAVDQLVTYNGTGPVYSKLGAGLSRSGSTLTISPASTQISDSTVIGRTVLTAADAAAVRSAIGAGTSGFSGAYGDLSGLPTLFDGQYSSLTGIPSAFAPAAHNQAWSTITSTPITLDGYGITDGVRSVTAGTGLSGGTITGSGTISLPSTGTAGSYSGVITDAQGRVTAGTVRSFAYTTRVLNTCFQVSGTRDALVSYSVDIAATLGLAGGQQGTVYLRIYTDSGCTAGTQELTRFVNGNTGALTVGLSVTQNVTGTLTGIVPAGSYVQLVTQNNTGTPTFAARPGQEVLL